MKTKIHYFCIDLPQSDACFVNAYPRETTEAFLDGHVSAFAFSGGVPLSILYYNTKDRGGENLRRREARADACLHRVVQPLSVSDRFGRPAKGNDKGKVEGLVKFSPSNFMVPVPIAASFDEWNAHLTERCLARQAERADRHADTIGERLVADTQALRPLPAMPLSPARSGRRACR